MSQYLGAGVAACYRGPVLYYSNSTQAIYTKWITFYKAHRGTMIQPVVHLRRPDMQGWDGIMHVNPFSMGETTPLAPGASEVAVAMIFNPTLTTINVPLFLPLYYTGLNDTALVSVDGGAPVTMTLARDYSIVVNMAMPPTSIHTIVINQP